MKKPTVARQLRLFFVITATAVRVVCGTADESINLSRQIHDLLTANQLEHDYIEVPDAPHDTTPLVTRPGADDFAFAARHFRDTKP